MWQFLAGLGLMVWPVASTLKSVEQRKIKYTKSGMNETLAEAEAWHDTFPSVVADLTGGLGKGASVAEKLTDWSIKTIYKKTSNKETTKKITDWSIQKAKNIGKFKAPNQEQLKNFRHAQREAQRQSTLQNTAREVQKQQMSKEWQKFLNDAKNNDVSKFTKLEPANLGTSNQPVAGVANTNGVADATELLVKYTPITYENPLGWLRQLGNILSGAAGLLAAGVGLGAGIGAIGATSAAGASTSVSAEIVGMSLHTGGIVVPKYKGGRNEMIAILQGGETVRTEAQEKELQDAKMKEFIEAYAPLVSGKDNSQDPYAQVFGNNKTKKQDPKMPVLMNKTRHDEEMIIAIVADAWRSNRSGFRNALRYN